MSSAPRWRCRSSERTEGADSVVVAVGDEVGLGDLSAAGIVHDRPWTGSWPIRCQAWPPRNVIGHSFRRGTSPVHRRGCSLGPPCGACCAPRDTSGSRPPARMERRISSSSGAPGSTTPSTSREATGPGGRATSRVTRGSLSGAGRRSGRVRPGGGGRRARSRARRRCQDRAPIRGEVRGGLRLSAARGAIRERTDFRARPTKLIAFDVRRFNTSATRFTFQPTAGEENADER